MPKKNTFTTQRARERAFLVGIEFDSRPANLGMEESVEELALLCSTADLDVVGEIYQRLDHPNPSTYIGSGKVQELKALAEETMAEVIIFDDELSPRHLRELEKIFGENVRVIDRTTLILDIFAQHAQTREGKLQVELAQYEYRLPRLTRAWTHLARQAGGGGGRTGAGGVGLRGPGETQLEVDRREIHRKITKLNDEIEKIRAHRSRHRVHRKRSQVPVTTLVGYTNAGKSTLLNQLSKSDIYVANQLFATLDPTTRSVRLSGDRQVLVTDTVGFIQKLPTQLIAAFRATLEEITEADLLINVVNINHPNAYEQWSSVQNTLIEIGAGDIPVITALNKIDLLPEPIENYDLPTEFHKAIPISAKTGENIGSLIQEVEAHLYETYAEITVNLPFQQGHLISLFHQQGQINSIEHDRNGVKINGRIPGRYLMQFHPFLFDPNSECSDENEN